MSQTRGSNLEDQEKLLESEIEAILDGNDLFSSIESCYNSTYLIGDNTDPWNKLKSFEAFNDTEYRDIYTDEGSMVVIFPDLADSNPNEDIFDLTGEILDEGADGIVVPSSYEGRIVYPPRDVEGMELVDSYWNQDGFRDKALLYENQSK